MKLWEGGLSFHGGLAGVFVASLLFARRRQVSWRRVADALVLAAPPGIFVVRIANFVNGELFGRIAPAGLPWGMRFPTDPAAQALSPELARRAPELARRLRRACARAAPGRRSHRRCRCAIPRSSTRRRSRV